VPCKILARIVLNRVKDVVELRLRKEQAGFCRNHSFIDLINTLRIILEQSNEWEATLYLTFIDFEKAFDSLDRRTMWKTLKEYGIPKKILKLIKSMYDGFSCKILHEGKLTEHINVTNGVRQGCILSPTIFLLVLDSIMRKVTDKKKRGIQWGMISRLEDLDFADDICLLTQRLI
jgi:hypothetical protein